MKYGNDLMNNMPFGFAPQYRPCGTYNGAIPAAMNQGVYQPQPTLYNGSVMGAQQALPTLPSGFPTGGTATPLLPTATGLPSTIAVPVMNGGTQIPTTVESTLYTPGFLRTQIGRKVRVEFLIGTNGMTDRTGTLLAVGASYILIRPIESDDIMMCDIYSIKFVTIIL